MPALAVRPRRILVRIDLHQLGYALHVRGCRMHVKIAEAPAEGQMLLGREGLIAKKDDEVFGERAVDLVELAIRQRLGEIDAADLGADDRRQLVYGDGLVWGALTRHMTNSRPGFGVQHGVLSERTFFVAFNGSEQSVFYI